MKSIRTRLIAGLGLIVVFFIAQAGLLWYGQNAASHDVVDMARKNTIASSSLSELSILAQQARRHEQEYFVYVGNADRRDGYIKEWTAASDKMTALIKNMRANTGGAFTAGEVGKMTDWAAASSFYAAEMQKIFAQVNDRAVTVAAQAPPVAPTKNSRQPAPTVERVELLTPVEVNLLIGAGKDRLSSVLIKGAADMSAEKTKQTLALSDVAAGGFNQLFQLVLITVGLGILVALFLMFSLPTAVTKPLTSLTDAVDTMSKGDLDKPVDTAGVPEFAGLAVALERLRIGQQALVQRMRARQS